MKTTKQVKQMGPIQNKPMLKGSTEGKVYKGNKTVKDATDQSS